MHKPTYYLWKKDFSSEAEWKTVKETYRKLGFRVVTFLDGPEDKNIHDGLKAVLQNHYGNTLLNGTVTIPPISSQCRKEVLK